MKNTTINVYLDPNKPEHRITLVLVHAWRDMVITAAICCPVCVAITSVLLWQFT